MRPKNSPQGGWERRKLVSPRPYKDGMAFLCPYCTPTHPLDATQNPCGTRIEVRAIQKTYKGVECALCKGTQGTLVRAGNLYKHVHDCTPGKKVLSSPPQFSRLAGLVWKAPAFVHLGVARLFRRAVMEYKREGVIVGYGWERLGTHAGNQVAR